MKQYVMGNGAIALGALSAGVRLVAGYPGTPSSEIIETVSKYPHEGVHLEWSVNEKAAERTKRILPKKKAFRIAPEGCRVIAQSQIHTKPVSPSPRTHQILFWSTRTKQASVPSGILAATSSGVMFPPRGLWI